MSDAEKLVAPRSVAVVGASELGGKNYYGARVMRNLVDSAGDLTVYAVNPRYHGQQVMGADAFARLSDIPEPPDLVIVAIPPAAVIDVLVEAGELGVKTCVVLTRESGGEAAREHFEQQVRDVARRYPMQVIGPNSMGVLCGTAMVNGSFASGAHGGGLRPGPLAMISQSGSSISYLLQLLRHSEIGYSWLISTGDEAALSLEALFEQVVEDPETQVVLLFVEGVTDGGRFRRAALRARTLGKPVVMLQVGVSAAGREAVHTHTGRLAGVETAFEAVAGETGIVRVSSFERLYDVATAMVDQALPRKDRAHTRRALVVTTSGGAGAYTADHLSNLGWSLPPLSGDLRQEIETISGQYGLQNPVDVTGTWAQPDMLPSILRAAAADSTFDTLLIASGAGGSLALGVAEALAAVRAEIPQELYVGWVGMSAEVAEVLARARISAFPDPARAVHAAEAGARFRQDQRDVTAASEVLELLSTRPADQPQSPGHDTTTWTAGRTLAALASAGLPCAPGALSEGLDLRDVKKLAAEVGYPLAIKLDSPALSHKTDQGGVAIGITDAEQLEVQFGRLADIAKRNELAAPRILVQRMTDGIEVLVGLKRDPAFGLLLVLGVGGTQAELFPAVNAAVLPTVSSRIAAMIDSHPVLSRLLAGYRGAEAGNRDALIDVVQRFAQWGLDHGDELLEADVNPVMVNGTGAVAVDARAVFGR